MNEKPSEQPNVVPTTLLHSSNETTSTNAHNERLVDRVVDEIYRIHLESSNDGVASSSHGSGVSEQDRMEDDDEGLEFMIKTYLNLERLDEMLNEMFLNEHVQSLQEYREKSKKEEQVFKLIESLILEGECIKAFELLKAHFPSVVHHPLHTKFHIMNLKEMILKCPVDDYEQQAKCLELCKSTIPSETCVFSSPEHTNLMDTLFLLLREKDNYLLVYKQLQQSRSALLHDFKVFWYKQLRQSKKEDSTFEVILKYLTTIHNIYQVLNGATSPVPEIESLLLPEKELFSSKYETSNAHQTCRERHVIEMTQRMSITREEAMQALIASNHDRMQAMKLEASRLQLNKILLADLVEEHCKNRGLILPMKEDAISRRDVMTKNIQEMLASHKYEELVQFVNSVDSFVLSTYPVITFRIYECMFLHHYNCCEDTTALSIASEKLAPIRLRNEERLDEDFSDTVSLLAYDHSTNPVPEHAKNIISRIEKSKEFIVKTLSEVLFDRVGKPSRLVKAMKYLLFIHNHWFQYDADEMVEYLSIHTLKESTLSNLKISLDSIMETNSLDPKEQDIQSIMDITQLSREEAESLLNQHKTVEDSLNAFFQL
ncbi:hypothetical protein C9374_014613 [Naegleria lovaniensis]|uniref:Uncharacterized protein n=1 Tax=Naegleria lovaniensis TaxID=51637 RepID=A0AA88KPA2_NAELO|nr:uncharacterized protein C9374_014613 [Naegleria lovaniensis]KAG2389213.1 hypothetical protein C9374_014613 [Naegleria lovaniensis]